MWQGTFVLEHLAKITAIDPAAAGWAFDEMLGLVRLPPHRTFQVDHFLQSSSVSLFTAGASGFLKATGRTGSANRGASTRYPRRPSLQAWRKMTTRSGCSARRMSEAASPQTTRGENAKL